MLWVEGPLSYVEVLCAQSFLDAGHHVELYHYGPVENVPAGVECVDGATILEIDTFVRHGRTGSLALFSDLFRYHLLSKRDRMIWADLDAYCAKPFTSDTGHFYGWESEGSLNGGVLGLPQDSDALGQLLEMTADENTIPDWVPKKHKLALQARADATGVPPHVRDMPWGVWGPRALTAILQRTGEVRYALPAEGLYPVSFRNRRMIVRSRARSRIDALVTPRTFSVHFYGRWIREMLRDLGGRPEAGSYLDGLILRHGIDMAAAPLERSPSTGDPISTSGSRRARSADPYSSIADKLGSRRGMASSRYGEAYHLLFSPYRNRRIGIVELGAPDGPRKPGTSAREMAVTVSTSEAYFPKAKVYSVFPSGVAEEDDEKIAFDPEDLSGLGDRLGAMSPAPGIVFHQGGCASDLQQALFLEIFPKLPRGAVYVFEGLHWQPRRSEPRRFTKTANLLRSFQSTGAFAHQDPDIAARFNDIRDQIGACLVLTAEYRNDTGDKLGFVQRV